MVLEEGEGLGEEIHTFFAAFAACLAAFAAESVVRAALTAVAVPFFLFLRSSRTGRSRPYIGNSRAATVAVADAALSATVAVAVNSVNVNSRLR